jgi:hypothetical protein
MFQFVSHKSGKQNIEASSTERRGRRQTLQLPSRVNVVKKALT